MARKITFKSNVHSLTIGMSVMNQNDLIQMHFVEQKKGNNYFYMEQKKATFLNQLLTYETSIPFCNVIFYISDGNYC